MLYNAQKNKGALQKMMFLFSSSDFNQFRRRLDYLEQYAKARKSQAREIIKVTEYIEEQNQSLIRARQNKKELLEQEKEQREKLEDSRNQQQKLLASLGKKESELRSELKKRKADAERLEKLIKRLVEKELEKNRNKSSGKLELTPEAAQLAATFEKNKRKLPWPVRTGFVSEKFGDNNHPVLRGVKVKNDGIELQSSKGEKVRSVFEGTVLTIAIIPGNNTAVMIKHGNYISVYAGIRNIQVKKGDKVSTKDIIGEVATDANGVSKMQFQIWRDFEKLNPEEWLARQ